MANKSTKWIKLFEDFISKLRIDSKEETAEDDRGIEFDMWDSQRRFMQEIAEGLEDDVRTFICLKSRQLGISTISLAIDLFWLAIHPGIIGALVTDSDENRESFRTTLKRYLKSFPPGYFGASFQLAKGGDNRNYMMFTNGSRLHFLVAGKKKKVGWGEGKGFAFAHLTEVSAYGDAGELASFEEALSQKNPNRLVIYESPLALDTPLPTPTGWTTMGAVQEGDLLINEEGKPCRVEGTSPVFINRECYRVSFDNGDSIVADAGHKWRVVERRFYNNALWHDLDLRTDELDPDKHVIMLSQPLQLPDAALPIDPYLLGVWLGDGATAEVRVTAGDEDIDEMREILDSRGLALGVITRSKDRAGMFSVLGQRDKFTRMGLRGNKHIPPAYLRASEPQRRALLAGLMDTDGSVHKTNFQCNFASTCEPLLAGVEELLSSLGIKYVKSVNSVEGKVRLFPGGNYSVCRESWRLLFSEFPDRRVFNLSRKRRIQETPRKVTRLKTKRLRIVSVEAVPSVPVRCVAVDTPSHLFLAGETMVPTHNTAKGMNHWKDKWDDAGQDVYSKRRFFIGWWASKVNVIERGEKLYQQYGVLPPSGEEIAKMDAVAKLYRHYVTPEQLAWYRWKQASARGGASQILDQNQPWTSEEAFIQTGYSFFPVRRIQEDLNRISYNGSEPKQYKGYKYMMGEDFWSVIIDQIKDPNLKAQIDLRVWEEPVEGGRYVIGCDPAFGRNEHKDRSACSVWRCYADCIVQVAEYASAMHETRQMSWVLAHLAGAYKDCIVNLEIGGPGHTIMVEWTNIKDRLRAEMYAKRVADMGWDDFLNQARWYLYHRPDSMGAGYVANFETTWRTKQVLMNQFRDSYSTKQLSISSVPLLNEMVIVVQDGAQIGAPESSGEHAKDDRVFAAALANRAWIDWVRPDMIGQGLTYESVMALESGEQTKIGTAVNRAVANYFKRMEELADLPVERGPQWMIDRGLI